MFDKTTQTHIQRNEERSELIEKAKAIFNAIIDMKDDGVTVAGIITHVAKFEEAWEKFPKTQTEINVETADKLIQNLCQFPSSPPLTSAGEVGL